MYKTALLLLTGPWRMVVESISQYLKTANVKVSQHLYVKLEPELSKQISKSDSVNLRQLANAVPLIYNAASSVCKNLNVRVLLSNFKQSSYNYRNSVYFDVILTNNDDDSDTNRYIESNFDCDCKNIVKLDKLNISATDISACQEEDGAVANYEVFKTVCLGGTFDRLHNGHKVLLSEGVLRASEKLIVGVSDGLMIKKKTLTELIEPVEKRINNVCTFLKEIDPSLDYQVVPINDVYGPTVTEPNIDCLVVTTETLSGGQKVNEERNKRGMHEVPVFVIDLVENTNHSPDEEVKLSSSTNRMQLLGKPLKNLHPSRLPNHPYCILLQGNPVSNLSLIANRFQQLGLPVLSCDKILRAILEKDCDLRAKVSELFLEDLSFVPFHFDKMTFLCLKNQVKRVPLANLVQPRINSSLQQVLKVYSEQGASTVLITGCTLFEENDLQIDVQETWSAILPIPETIQRLVDKFHFTETKATIIVESFKRNQYYVDSSNIIFCTKWSTETTIQQVERAWEYLNLN